MIILLYGPDSYRSQEKLNQIIDKYKQSDKLQSGLFVFDQENFELGKFGEAAASQSFFNDKKLVVVKNIFTEKSVKDFNKILVGYLDSHKELFSSKEIVIVFWESREIKSNNPLFKFLTQKKLSVKTQEFKSLTDSQLKKWIQDSAGHNLKISQPALQNLILYAGDDLWRLANEIKKLISYKRQGEITIEDVDAMVAGSVESNIFKATDSLGQKDFKKAFCTFSLLREKGEDKLYLFSMIVYQFRNLIRVKEQAAGAAVPANIIAKKLKMHPFVAQKTLVQARNFSLRELKNIYRKLLDFDVKIKTGRIEPALAIDSVIYGLI